MEEQQPAESDAADLTPTIQHIKALTDTKGIKPLLLIAFCAGAIISAITILYMAYHSGLPVQIDCKQALLQCKDVFIP